MALENVGQEEGKSSCLLPDILQYRCYRRFLHDYYQFRKAHRGGFSYRRFAQLCGLQSPNYLQLVINGARNLSTEMSIRVAKAMRDHLTAQERQFFVGMVRKSNAQTTDERERSEADLLVARKNLVAKFIPDAEAEILSKWYHTVVRELTFLVDFEPNGEWVARKLRKLITPEQADESLQLLLRAGYLSRKDGRLIATDPVLTTGHEMRSSLIRQIHAQTLKTWSRLVESLDRSERELGLLHLPIRSELIPEMQTRIRRFQDEIIGWLMEQQSNDPDQIVQLGTFLIPITKAKG